jgi:predicted transcriptional regulator
MAREVLMSIHRGHVDEIFDGVNRWEFRRRTALRPGERVWMYATAPSAAVLGWFEVGQVLELDAARPNVRVAREGRSTPQELAEYFSGRIVGLRIGSPSARAASVRCIAAGSRVPGGGGHGLRIRAELLGPCGGQPVASGLSARRAGC